MAVRNLLLFFFLLPCWNPELEPQTLSNSEVQNNKVRIVKQDESALRPDNCDLEKLKGLPVSPVVYQGDNEPIKKVLPEYPQALREKGIAGEVAVTIWFYDKNVVLACAYSGREELRPLVEKAVMQWQFKPQKFGDEKVCSRTVVVFEFIP